MQAHHHTGTVGYTIECGYQKSIEGEIPAQKSERALAKASTKEQVTRISILISVTDVKNSVGCVDSEALADIFSQKDISQMIQSMINKFNKTRLVLYYSKIHTEC